MPPFEPGRVLVHRGCAGRRSSIDDAAVDQALERLRERAARFEPVEEASSARRATRSSSTSDARGSTRTASAGEKTKHERVPIEIGAAVNPPGSTTSSTGLTPEARQVVPPRFPDDYSVAELAGTEVAYT